MGTGVDEPQPLRSPLLCWHESLVSARTDPLVSLSADGAFIATDRPVPAGTPLFLELSQEEEGARAEVDAVAVAGAGPEPGFAVRFVALDDDARRFVAARLAEERRAREPDVTLIPTSVEADATSDVELLPPPGPIAPPARAVAPIELEAADDEVRLTAADLSPPVPEAQSPARDDAIELEGLSLDTAAFDELPAPSAPAGPSVGLDVDLDARLDAESNAELDAELDVDRGRAAAAPATEVELDLGGELELEPPAMAAMPSPPATPVPEPEPAQAAPPASPVATAGFVAAVPAPAAVADTMPVPPRTSPAPVPEAEQTIKWARAPALAPLVASPGPTPARNPFSSGDSNLSNPFAPRPATSPPPREETQRFSPSATSTAARDETLRFTPPPARTATPVREETQRFAPAPGPASGPARSEIDQTRPWSRAALVEGLPRTPSPQPPRLRTPPLDTALPGAELPPLARAPMPRIASMEVPGSASPPAIEQTQRWPTAKVRVADAPLEMPVGEVPFSQPPELAEQSGIEGGLDALFPSDGSVAGVDEPAFAEPMLDPRLEVKPALDVGIELDESFEPAPAPPASAPPAPSPFTAPAAAVPPVPPSAPVGFRGGDDTLPLPAAPGVANPFQLKGDTAPLPPSSEDFGPSGGMLGADDDLGVGGNAGDLFGGVEITDPGAERRVPATAEDGFEAPDNIGPTLDANEPLELTAVDDAEPVDMVEVSDLDEYGDVLGAPTPAAPTPAAPTPAAAAPPMFDELEAEPVVTAEIPAETQERLLHAAMSKPPVAPPAATGPVRTDPLFSQPVATPVAPSRPEPKPTETQPYFSLGALGSSLPPLPPPPPSMTRSPPPPSTARPPPLPPRAGTPPLGASPAPAPGAPVASAPPVVAQAAAATPVSPTPQRTDPFFPSWPGEGARPASPHDPFAGLSPRPPASAVAPLLGNAVVNPPTQEPLPDLSGDSFFDEMAFQAADQSKATLPTPADQWQVQQSSGEAAPMASAEDDDIPVVMGRTATPSTANPWTVGEPAKKS